MTSLPGTNHQRVHDPAVRPVRRRSPLPAGLSPRELQVLCSIAAGRTCKEVADDLVLSVRTVERHITHVYAKIGARGRAHATLFALRNGLLDGAGAAGP